MDLSGAVEFGKAFADLGDTVGRQWQEAITQFEASGSDTPIADSNSNPNAFSTEGYEAIRRFRRALVEADIEYADEFLSLVDAELAHTEELV